jgi:hypothetical protein
MTLVQHQLTLQWSGWLRLARLVFKSICHRSLWPVSLKSNIMITCYLRYIINPFKLNTIEHYGKVWIPLVER